MTKVSQNFVFEHPTLRDLASAIASLVDPSASLVEEDPVDAILSMIDLYSSNLPNEVCKEKSCSRDDIIVLFTGTTGNIGSHTLAALLTDPRISRVYTLNRLNSASTGDRQTTAFKERDLPVELLKNSKLVGLYGDIALSNFGLKQTVYDEVCVLLVGFASRR